MLNSRNVLSALGLVLASSSSLLAQQAVTAVYTDFGGVWYSANGAQNATQPNDHHHLLAFTVGGTTYSTGVSDATLDGEEMSYTATQFTAVTVPGLSTTPANDYYVMLGSAIDGDELAAGAFTAPESEAEVAAYLTDGTRGLDFGTGIANIPAGSFDFTIDAVDPSAIGDGVPDLLFTQMADPAASVDSVMFLDGSGNLVASRVGISWLLSGPVGKWRSDYYTMDGTAEVLNAEKRIRLVSMDFQDLNVTSGNAGSIEKIRIVWSGASDPAFIAYNDASFTAPESTCEGFTFSGVQAVAASAAASEDGTLIPVISGGTSPYRLALVMHGDTLSSSEWNTIPSGNYWLRAVDANDCVSSSAFTINLPYRKCE